MEEEINKELCNLYRENIELRVKIKNQEEITNNLCNDLKKANKTIRELEYKLRKIEEICIYES